MRHAALLLLIACADVAPPRPTAAPAAAIDEPVAPSIRVPVHAEADYEALGKDDPRLDRAAEELAYFVGHGGEASSSVATRVLRMHGIVEPPQRVVAGTAAEDLTSQLGEDRFHSNFVVGRGVYETSAVEILVFLPKLRVEPVARAASDGFDLAVDVDEPLHPPRVTVADASSSAKLEPVATEHGFRVHVPCGTQPSERYVSIEASDPRTPLVIFPLYCKLAAPTSFEAEPKSNLAGITDERIVAILDSERTTRNLPALHHDARAAAAARAHVKERAAGRSSDPAAILKRANLPSAATAWTTVHVDSVDGAIDRILNSSEEMAKLLDPERTDVGAAMQRVDDGWWVSVIYMTIPKAIDADREALAIRHRIAAANRSSRDPYADIVAQHCADELAVGWSDGPLRVRALADLRQHNGGGGAQLFVERRAELRSLDVPSLIEGHRFKYFGVGVAQSARDGALTGTIWVVLMLY